MNRSLRGRLPWLCALLVGSLVALNAWAQTDTHGKPELSPEERAQRQADKVFTFIKFQALKPAAKRPSADAPLSAPPAAPVQASAQTKAATKAPTRLAAAEARPQAPLQAALVAQTAVTADAQPAPDLIAAATPLALAGPSTVMPPLEPTPAVAAPEVEPEPPPLRLLSKVEPEIPRQLQSDFKGGAVTVQFTVQPDGTVGQAQAVHSSHKRLAAAAVSAVNQWRFAPLPSAREASVDIAFSVE